MNKEDSFYMDTLEKTQPETFDFINHLSEQCHSELSFASHESITSSRLSGVPIS